MKSPSPRHLLLAAATLVAASSAHAADFTWNGSVGADWHTAGNWTPGTVPGGTGGATTDRAIFDGVGSQNAVTFGTLVGTSPNSVGGTIGMGGILVTGGQTSALSINNSAGATRNFRLSNATGITLESGAGAFSMGTGGDVFQLVLQGNSTFTFQNDSANTATLGNKITLLPGGGFAPTARFAGTGNWLVEGVISGSGTSLSKIGAGTLTLTGTNSYSGGTAIDGGILAISKNNSLGTGGVTFDGGTLRVNNAAFTASTAALVNTLSVAEGKTGAIDLVGTGAVGNDLTLNTGAITVDGTLKITRLTGGRGTTNVGSLFSGSGLLEVGDTNSGDTIALSNNGRLWVRNNNAFANFHGSVHILSNGNLALFGSSEAATNGQLVNGNDVTIDAGGYLSLISSRTSTIGNLDGAGTIVKNNGSGTAVLKIASGDFSGVINQSALGGTGAISIEKTGNGTLKFSGANNYTGATTISGGELAITGAGSVHSSSAIAIAEGATFRYSSTATQTFGAISGKGDFIRDTTATGNKTFSGNNSSFEGTMTFETGLNIFNAAAAGSASAGFVVKNSASILIDANGSKTVSFGSLSGDATSAFRTGGTSASGTQTASIGARNEDTEFAGTISQPIGTLAITKVGTGTLTLSGANSYSGATTISGGTLLANNLTGSATGTGAVSVAAGARLGGTGFVTGAVNVTGVIRGGTGEVASGTLTVGNVTLAAGSVVELALGASGTHSSLNFNGTESFQNGQVFSFLDLGATTGTYAGLITGVTVNPNTTGTWLISNDGWTGTFSWNAGTNAIDLNLTAIPEPSTYGLIGAGALAAVAMVRRRRKYAGAVAA